MTERENSERVTTTKKVDGGGNCLYCRQKAAKISRYFNKLLTFFSKFDFYSRPSAGVILILMLSVIPVLLLGPKYVLDQRTHDKVQMENGGIEYYKASAKEAALAVAENWNPGLTLNQQKDAAYKVADAVYNTAVGYNLSIVNQAVQ